MAQRTVIINPGSTSWWLQSLSPVLYYDRIDIDPKGIEDILKHGDRSSYHERAARMIELILNNSDEEILRKNNHLPARGQTRQLKQKSQEITDRLIREANNYSMRQLSLIKPGELKKALRTAYRHWIRHNRLKIGVLQKDEPLHDLLIKVQVPQSLASLEKIEETHVGRIPQLLEKDNQLKRVLRELVRNALLIMDLGKDSTKRVYDGLFDEFLPTIELVERIRVFRDLPHTTPEPLNFSLLMELYSFRLSKVRASSMERINVTEAFRRAFKERKRLRDFRLKIAEFDALIIERNLKPDQALKSMFTLIKDINRTVKHIDTMGTWAMWGTGAYLLGEMVSSLSASAHLLLKTILLNPLTVKATKEFVQNYYMALSGLNPKSSSYISIIRDHVAARPYSRLGRIYKVRPNVFEFWV